MIPLRHNPSWHAHWHERACEGSYAPRPLLGGCICPTERKQPLEVAVNLLCSESCSSPASIASTRGQLGGAAWQLTHCVLCALLCLGGWAPAAWRQCVSWPQSWVAPNSQCVFAVIYLLDERYRVTPQEADIKPGWSSSVLLCSAAWSAGSVCSFWWNCLLLSWLTHVLWRCIFIEISWTSF